MNPEFEQQLSAYLDGELSPDDEARLRAAIAASPELAGRLAELESVDAALAALPVPELPAGAKARLRARIAAEAVAPGARPPLRRRRTLFVAAAAVAAALLVWLVLPRTGDQTSFIAEQPTPVVPSPHEPVQERGSADLPQIADAPAADLPDLLAPDDISENLAVELADELDAEDVAVVEVLEWLAVLEGLEPDGGRG